MFRLPRWIRDYAWPTYRLLRAGGPGEQRRFLRHWRAFRTMPGGGRFAMHWRDLWPCLGDWTSATSFDRHYVYHTAWAARALAQTRPARHVDISSTLYFVVACSAFVPMDFYDYRPAALGLSGLTSARADLLALPFAERSLPSLSCMHVVEHVGLGRYGEPLDPEGDLRAMRELQRVLAPGGNLLFVVPVGRARICFNAHRIYPYQAVVQAFPELTLKQFALIPDQQRHGGLIVDADPRLVESQQYACGCFWFVKS